MNHRHTTGFCCAVALGFTVSVSAQQGSTTSSGAQASQDTSTQADSSARTVTVTGCIQKEVDIFKTRGIGSSDEFVLTKASSGSAAMASAGTSSSADASSSSSTAPQDGEDASDRLVGTSGATLSTSSAHGAHGSMYSLTGDREDELTRLVGRRVEVIGRLEHSGDAMNAGHEDAVTRGAVGTSGNSDSTREEADEAEGVGASDTAGAPSDDDNQPRATNTGRGDRIPGRAGAATPEEIAAADARERLQALPRVNITSFRDLGACDAQ